MPNMSYCRFTNTRSDLNDCLDAICRDERLRYAFETACLQEADWYDHNQ